MKHGRRAQPKAVEKREIELRLISAQDLEDVKRIGKMRCYAVAYIDPKHKVTTPVDENGGINPSWNQKLLLQADDELLSNPLAAITVDIYASGHLRDKLAGTARVLIPDILKNPDNPNPNPNPINCMAVQVWKPSGEPQGILNIWIPPTGKFLLRRLSLTMSKKETPAGLQCDADETTSISPPAEAITAPPAEENTASPPLIKAE
ncbi:hypothetical protein SUGI_0023100 [Cryptomeria japonica]|uniref:uncharacterized protein LOC131060926 n=1 Tax=Cryptomeria japonica TaxID=3369 RepID=UPI002408A0CB|nr:uncharacterized protein LOC131060926 [Cryptomeria japonica]GLJ05691.1 hypothetical protein SUGI_0023100 [Cryptomeria japonica]